MLEILTGSGGDLASHSSAKQHTKKKLITSRHQETAQNTGREMQIHRGQEDKNNKIQTLWYRQGMGLRSRPPGGGEEMRKKEAYRGREGNYKWISPRGL